MNKSEFLDQHPSGICFTPILIPTWCSEFFAKWPSGMLTSSWFSNDPDSDLVLRTWIAESTEHFIAWEGLQFLHQTLTEYDLPVPVELSDWANDVVWGKRKPPKRKKGGDGGADGTKNIFRDIFIVLEVKQLELYGIPATSTTIVVEKDDQGMIVGDHDRISACRYVAKCRSMKYAAVCKVWQSSRLSKLREALGKYSGDPTGFRAWVGEQIKNLLDQVDMNLPE